MFGEPVMLKMLRCPFYGVSLNGENITPLEKTISGHIPGFLGSPYHKLVVIPDKWGPLQVCGNVSSPSHIADNFRGLDKDIVITKEQQLDASTMTWALLNALN